MSRPVQPRSDTPEPGDGRALRQTDRSAESAGAVVDVAAETDDGVGEGASTAGVGKEGAQEMRRSHVRGSTMLVAGRVLTILITTATQVVLVRALTKEDFGAFAYALAIAAAGRTLLSLGQGKLLSQFMAKYEEEGDYNRMFGAMFLAVGTILVTSTILVGSMYALPGALIGDAVNSSTTEQVVLILVLLAPLEALDQVFVSLFAVFSNPRAIFFRKYLLTPGLRLLIVLVLAFTGSSVTFLATGYLVAGAVGLALYIGVFVLGHYGSASDVAGFRAVFNPSRLNNAVQQAFLPMFLPLAARLFARSDIAGLRRSYWQTAAFVAVLTFPVFALTGPLAPDLTVLLFGERYADSAVILAILSVGYYFSVILGFNVYVLQVCERIRFLVGVNLFVMVLNIAVSLLLVHRFGGVGVAVANLTALVVHNLLNQWALRRTIGTALIDRRCIRCYLVIVAAAGALWAIQAVFEPGLLIGLATAVVASLVVLAVSRDAIELGESFPELRKIPVVRWLVR